MLLAEEACVEHEPCILCGHCLTCQHRMGSISPYCLMPECATVCRDEWPDSQVRVRQVAFGNGAHER